MAASQTINNSKLCCITQRPKRKVAIQIGVRRYIEERTANYSKENLPPVPELASEICERFQR